jgi:hypothetical protein
LAHQEETERTESDSYGKKMVGKKISGLKRFVA